MDLISKKALLNDLCEDREEGTFCFTDSQAEAADKIIMYVTKRINAQPSVPAVPLEPLAKWLSENSINIPCEACPNFSNEYCTAIGDASKPCPKTANDWWRAITEWMEEPQCTSTDTEP